MQEPEQGAVDVQGVGPAEPGPGEQRQDVFEAAQGAGRAERERGGQRPGDQQRHDVRVGEGRLPVVAGDGAQVRGQWRRRRAGLPYSARAGRGSLGPGPVRPAGGVVIAAALGVGGVDRELGQDGLSLQCPGQRHGVAYLRRPTVLTSLWPRH